MIIGSGVGGSIAAFRLAEAGIDNLVLERGRRWPITPAADTFPHLPSFDKRQVWLEGSPSESPLSKMPGPLAPILKAIIAKALPRSTGLLDIRPHRDLILLCGAGVGGGTLVYGGMLPQPRPGPFHSVFPAELDYGELDRVYYPRARRRMGAARFPEDLLSHPRYRSSRIWRTALHDAGLPVEPIVAGYDFDIIRAELAGTARPSASVGQYFLTGCNSGAKLSVDRTYLARAEATGKTTVRPLHQVTGIGQDRHGRYQVGVQRLTDDGEAAETLMLTCDRLVVAAGGVHTPRMLVTARATGALPGLHEAVGTDWGTNGDQNPFTRTRGLAAGDRQGGPPAFLTRNPDGTAMIAHGGLPLPDGAGVMIYAATGIPDRLGRWEYDPAAGRARLEWSADNDLTAHRSVTELLQRAVPHIATGTSAHNPFGHHPLVFHPLGGAVLGKATDPYGRLHGYRGLYCLDSGGGAGRPPPPPADPPPPPHAPTMNGTQKTPHLAPRAPGPRAP
ncbi:GMC family oxidoreductase N-terminal domain-containing protein, partial [Spirillospora sp. NPDC050679]